MIPSYRVKHSYGVSDFLDSYGYLLQRAIDVKGILSSKEGKEKTDPSDPEIEGI